ncbi:MAG TPA: TonB-dependent receptor [Saprospiraceae bacterium]|nr:TonB-dependent receptor [Saprospiraceae bacterium]
MQHNLLRLLMPCVVLISFTPFLFSQKTPDQIKGIVMEETNAGKLQPLKYVYVYWLGSTMSTNTDSTGFFVLDRKPENISLVISYVGYTPDTIEIGNQSYVSIVLKGAIVLDEVNVVHRKQTTEVSYLNPMLLQNISQEELFKAACCNLSESFETNASVDVNFNDAVTGAKEIQMLGLAGRYTMLSQEFMPGIRGLGIPYGLLYTPGAWVQSMQITKGAGSVVNGFESIAGQINIELKKPQEDERFFVNGYVNEANRYELNVLGAIDLSPKLSTSLLTHGSVITKMIDRNDDGFTDLQEGELFVVANRWKFNNYKNLEGELIVKYTSDQKTGGQMGFDPDSHGSLYGVTIDAQRLDISGKTGFIFPQKRYQSIGFQWALSDYELNTQFGIRPYRGKQQTAYGNLIFQSILGTTMHKYKTGVSILADRYDEFFGFGVLEKEEVVPGAFFEYTYTPAENFTLVAGLRADRHNIYDVLITPRLHLRYAPAKNTVLRASAGRGYRSPNVIAENLSLLASSRLIHLEGDNPDLPLGFEMESAWNYGMSVSQSFTLDFRPGRISADVFHTSFDEQVVVDIDESPGHAHLYNLDGKSYSTSLQVEGSWEAMKRFDVRAAWRFLDVQSDHHGGLLEKQLTAKHRGFLNVAYTTPRKSRGHWIIDMTLQHIGAQRIPFTASNPEGLQLPDFSPSQRIIHAQITRRFTSNVDIYLGVENLLNFKQDDPILDADHPFGPYFDSALGWGSVFGRTAYLGVRYLVKRIPTQ